MTLKNQLTSELRKVLNEFGLPEIVPSVDYPQDTKHGDYSTNVALIAAKKLGKNPMEVGEDFKIKLLNIAFVEKIDVVRPGFINFWIKDEFLTKKLQSEIEIPNIGEGKKVVVEYSSPNIAKPFTIGHLRSTIIGDAVANLLQATGWQVYRDNHVGDWGTQFGKQIYAIKEWGNEEEIEKSDRPVKLLVDLYVKFHDEAEKNPELEDKAREWFKRLEDGDEEAKVLWQKCIDWSWKEFEKIYTELGVTFSENNGRGYGESFFENKMQPILEELTSKGFLKEGKEGAKIVEFSEETKLPSLMIVKKDGATLYATRDLATDKFRLSHYGQDVHIINEVGSEQELYFKQLYKLEEMLGWYKSEQRIHKKHGLYRFKEGKMSTRKGNVIWLEAVLEEAKQKALQLSKREFPENYQVSSFGTEDIKINKVSDSAKQHDLNTGEIMKLAKQVGIGALKWNDLKRSSEQDINFDWDEILNMQGNSGPYLQYTFARTQSVLAKARISNFQFPISNFRLEIEERELLRLLSRFPEMVEEAAKRLSPNILCNYLFELAQAFNLFYQKCPILKPKEREETDETKGTEALEKVEDIRDFRLGLTQTTGNVLQKGLSLLGIKAPEKM